LVISLVGGYGWIGEWFIMFIVDGIECEMYFSVLIYIGVDGWLVGFIGMLWDVELFSLVDEMYLWMYSMVNEIL